MPDQSPLLALMTDQKQSVREALLANPGLPSELLTVLAASPDRWIRTTVAQNRSTPTHVLAELITDGSRSVRAALAGNESTPRAVLEQLARDPEDSVRESVAGNSSTDAQTLRLLARAPNAIVKHVAGNTSTPADVLEDLAREALSDGDLTEVLVSNPSTPIHILETLITGFSEWDYHLRALWRAATHPLMPPQTLDDLARNRHESVRQVVARHPNTSADTLERLSRDSESGVREAALSNPRLPASSLEMLSHDDSWVIRTLVAVHPATPAHVVETLGLGEEAAVRLAVRMHRAMPVSNSSREGIGMVSVAAEETDDSDWTLRETLIGRLLQFGLTDGRLLSGSYHDVAGNESVPRAVLDLLSKEESDSVREDVARNTSSSPETLRGLASDSAPVVRAAAAGNISTPIDSVRTLSSDPVPDVRRASAANAFAVAQWCQVQEVASLEEMLRLAVDARNSDSWIPSLEGALQQLWLSPSGRWLCVHSIAGDDEGLLYVIDARRESILGTVPLVDQAPDEQDLDVCWSMNEEHLVVIEGKASFARYEEVHVQALALPTFRYVVQDSISHPSTWDIRSLGVYFSEIGDKFGVCLTDGSDGSDLPSYSIIVFELDTGRRSNILRWDESRYFPLVRSDLTCAYLVLQGDHIHGAKRDDMYYLLIGFNSKSKIIELDTESDEWVEELWLSRDEEILYMSIESDDGSRGVIEVDLSWKYARNARIPSGSFEPPPHAVWSFPSLFNGSWNVATHDGERSFSIDRPTNTLVRESHQEIIEDRVTRSGSESSVVFDERRRQIPLELPNAD